jgi:hypothetical protein
MEHQDRQDLVAVHDLASGVHGQHPVAVAVERDPEVRTGLRNNLLQVSKVGRAAADVDVRPVGLGADRADLGAELLEGLRRDPGVGPVRAVDDDLQAAQVGAKPLDDVFQVAVGGDTDVVDRAGLARERSVEQRLDLLLSRIGELASLAKNLTPL